MMMNNIKNFIEGSINVLILPHIHPDGDTLGSALALKLALVGMGKNAYIVIDDEIGSTLTFITNENIMSTYEYDKLGIEADLVISVDSSDAGRLGSRYRYIEEASKSINIDHHKTNTEYCNLNLVDENSAATGIIVYKLLEFLEVTITKEIAEAIYVAIVTDTGNFKYSNTDADTFLIAASLIKAGIDNTTIINNLYQNKPLKELYLIREALKNLTLYYNGKVSIIELNLEDFKANNISPTNTEGIIEFARDIEGVEVAIFIKEIDFGIIKVSLRSKNHVDVSVIAQKFEGGGHSKAAGCSFDVSIKEVREILLDTFKEIFD